MRLPPSRRSLHRVLLAGCTGLAALSLITCSDAPVAPEGAQASLAVTPRFDAFARFLPLSLDGVRLIVVRAPADTILRVSRSFSVDNPQLRLAQTVPLQAASESLSVTLQLLSGATLLFQGTSLVPLIRGAVTPPFTIPVSYRGPGSNIAALTLTPRDTTLHFGDTLSYQLSALDSSQADVAQYYVSWRLAGTVPPGATINGSGRLTAPVVPASFFVKVIAPNGTVDSTGVTIVPPAIITWLGAVDSAWQTAGNWDRGVLPSAADSVIIPATSRRPVLTDTATAGAVNVAGGGLRLNGHRLTVNRTFTTTGAGTVTMTDPLDQLQVLGDAIFAGGSTSGLLTAGQLTVDGNFVQRGTRSALSFAADTGHTTLLNGDPANISFANPGRTTSRFGQLREGGGDFDLATDVVVLGGVDGPDGFFGNIVGNNVAMTAARPASTTYDGVRLIVDDPAGTTGGVFGLRFINLPATVAQLTIRHPGFSGNPFGVSNVTFQTLPAGSTGVYIDATDSDGLTPNALVVYVDFDSGNNGPSFVRVAGGAQVFWPTSTFVWTGKTSSDWNVGGNWNTLQPPFQQNVTIPSGTPFAPQLLGLGAYTQANLTVQAGATLDLGTQGFTVTGAFDAPGTVTGTGQASLTLAGPTARGNSNVGTQVTAALALNGNLTIGGGASLTVNQGDLDLAGHTLNVSGGFTTTGAAGTMRMASAAGTDSLLVAGSAFFNGTSTSGRLTSGVVRVGGNFSTGQFQASEYAPSGTHKTILAGSTAQTVSFPTFGNAQTGRFNVVDISGATGGITLQTGIVVDSLLISTPASGRIAVAGGGNAIVTRQVQVTGLSVTNAPITLNELGVARAEQFDNVTFLGFPATGVTQLTVTGPGGAAAPRTLTFNGLVFSHLTTVGAGALYVSLVPTSGTLNLVLAGSSEGATAGGNGPAFTSVLGNGTVSWP